jgi:hypothetical protein
MTVISQLCVFLSSALPGIVWIGYSIGYKRGHDAALAWVRSRDACPLLA